MQHGDISLNFELAHCWDIYATKRIKRAKSSLVKHLLAVLCRPNYRALRILESSCRGDSK
jgi:hypothetical protein